MSYILTIVFFVLKQDAKPIFRLKQDLHSENKTFSFLCLFESYGNDISLVRCFGKFALN